MSVDNNTAAATTTAAAASTNNPLPILSNSRVTLIPFSSEHIELYNEWMSNPELLSSTGTEPMTITDIIELQSSSELAAQRNERCNWLIKDNLTDTLIGDIGLSKSTIELPNNSESVPVGELMLMIAIESYRHRGYSLTSIELVLDYLYSIWSINIVMVKIHSSNTNSISLFRDKLEFELLEFVECFDEYTFYKYIKK